MRGFRSSIPYLRHLTSVNDIVLISEHWLHSNKLRYLEDNLDNICVFARASRYSGSDTYGQGRGQGGVAILWKRHLRGIVPLNDITHDRFCGVRLQTNDGRSVNIFSLYLPSMGSGEDLQNTLDEFSGVLETRDPGERCIWGGDFNGDVGKLGGPRGVRLPTDRGRKVMELVDRYDMHIANLALSTQGPIDTFYGHNTSSCIDYLIVPNEMKSMIVSCEVEDEHTLNTSDHIPVRITVDLDLLPKTAVSGVIARNIKWNKMSKHEILERYTLPLGQKLQSTLQKSEHDLDSDTAIDDLIDEMVGCIHDAAQPLPRASYRKHIKPFWCDQLEALKRIKIFDHKNWKDAGRPRDADNALYIQYKSSKKEFAKCIKTISKNYENEQIAEITKSAEVDKYYFWKQLKRVRGDSNASVLAIKDQNGTVMHEVHEVLNVWKKHFHKVGTPKSNVNYDAAHFKMVNDFVKEKMEEAGTDEFSQNPFTTMEISKAVENLNKGKAPGPDLVTAEHVIHGGLVLTRCLTNIFNLMLIREYIPVSFRRGTQIPLFKGKNACSLNPSNYRGITLLSVLNKIYEILIWKRMEGWWSTSGAICGLQGAGKKGRSCLHSSLLLQETLATSMERSRKCFTVYFDVAKAYDTIWINGLFFQLHKLGIVGKTWRMLRKCYNDFKCRVRVLGHFSEWYVLSCGIHQGGYLSLIKYVAFTDPLLRQIRDSGLCCKIYKIPSVPVGYADDMAAACLTKFNIDRVIDIAYRHGCTWRYEFNGDKSAVLVLGESRREQENNSANRQYFLGNQKIPEKLRYDHLGVVSTTSADDTNRISGRLSKARRTLNAATGIGIRSKGLNMNTCNIIFWCIVVPTALFGCEVWCLTADDLREIESFQMYSGKRIQRLHPKSPNICGYVSLGWIHLEVLILIRKVLFLRTILVMDDSDVIKKVLVERVKKFVDNIDTAAMNIHSSPVFEMLLAANRLNMIDEVISFVAGTKIWSKSAWKDLTWKRGWEISDTMNGIKLASHKELDLLRLVTDRIAYSVWWVIADYRPDCIYFCETMIKILCHASDLKVDNPVLKKEIGSSKVCPFCEAGVVDDARHMIIQCANTQGEREEMFRRIHAAIGVDNVFLDNRVDILAVLMGRVVEGMNNDNMFRVWVIAGQFIHRMYKRRTKTPEGIG